MVIAHMGPFELPLGQTLSAEIINKVLVRTTVLAATSERGQWGVGQRFFLEGPPGRLNEAMELVQRLMAEPVGGDGNGDGNGDDEPCPHPKGRWDAWSEACSEAERAIDQADLVAEERAADGSEDEADGDVEEAYHIAWLKGYAACQLEFEQWQGDTQAHCGWGHSSESQLHGQASWSSSERTWWGGGG